jgi:hypothetical protein
MRHEKTQRGNPHRLTINQHVLPRKSIERFAENGMVQVNRLSNSEALLLSPDNPFFCAMRAWDQKAETVGSHSTENAFQAVVDAISTGHKETQIAKRDEAITGMYLLWKIRYLAKENRHEDVTIKGVTPDKNMDKNTEEILESKGYVFARSDGAMPGRFMAGIKILIGMDNHMLQMQGVRWGLLTASEGEFIVPDVALTRWVMPVSPKHYLLANMPDRIASYGLVAEFNSMLVESAQKYYFARDLAVCPIKKRTCIPVYFESGI